MMQKASSGEGPDCDAYADQRASLVARHKVNVFTPKFKNGSQEMLHRDRKYSHTLITYRTKPKH